jgi:hypothetical protein
MSFHSDMNKGEVTEEMYTNGKTDAFAHRVVTSSKIISKLSSHRLLYAFSLMLYTVFRPERIVMFVV